MRTEVPHIIWTARLHGEWTEEPTLHSSRWWRYKQLGVKVVGRISSLNNPRLNMLLYEEQIQCLYKPRYVMSMPKREVCRALAAHRLQHATLRCFQEKWFVSKRHVKANNPKCVKLSLYDSTKPNTHIFYLNADNLSCCLDYKSATTCRCLRMFPEELYVTILRDDTGLHLCLNL